MLLSLTWRKLSVSGGRKLSGTGTGTRLCVAAPGPGLRSSDPGPVRVTAGDVPVPLRNDQTLHAFQRHVCVSPRVFVHPGGTRKHPQLLPLPAGLRDTPWDPDWGSGSGLASVSGCVKTGTRTGNGTVDLLGVRGVFTGDYWGVYTTRRLHGSTTWTMQTGSMQTRSMQTRSGSTKSSGAGETQQNNNNKGVNDEQNVTTTTTKTSSSSSPSEEAEVGALTKTQQLKKVFKEYGAVGVTFHIGISLMSLGMFYLLVSSGIDMAAVLCKVGFSEAVVRSKMAAGTSTFVLAYAVHKLFAPLRISVTLVSVPLIVRYFRKVGHFKPPTPAP